jgi:hypothetical protein
MRRLTWCREQGHPGGRCQGDNPAACRRQLQAVLPEIRRCGLAWDRVDGRRRDPADFAQSIIDLLIPGKTPGIKGPIVDLSGRQDPEILFFGPDEVSTASRRVKPPYRPADTPRRTLRTSWTGRPSTPVGEARRGGSRSRPASRPRSSVVSRTTRVRGFVHSTDRTPGSLRGQVAD